MNENGSPKPTSEEWATAQLLVDRYEEEGEQVIVELKKSVTKGGRIYHQSIWLTLEQLQAVARDLSR